MSAFKKAVFIPFLTGVLFFCSCNQSQEPTSMPKTDSISKVVTELLVRDSLSQALAVIDSADASGWLRPFDAQMLRLRVKSRNESGWFECQQTYIALLEQDLSISEQSRVLEMLTYILRMKRDDRLMLEYGARYIEVCRQLGNTTSALKTQSEIGSVLIRLGRTDEGLEKIEDAIAQLDAQRQFAQLDACILAMKSKIRTLIDLRRYEEVEPVCKRMIAKLQDFASNPDVYADGSARLPNDKRRPGYIDFYTGQAYAFAAYACASSEQWEKARAYSQLFDQTQYSRSYSGRKQMASAWCMLGEYGRMKAIYDEMEAAMGTDTINHDYSVILYNRATEAKKKGQFALSTSLWQRYASVMRKLTEAERTAAAEESAARYHEYEQQYALDLANARLKRERLVAIGVCLISLFIVVMAMLIWVQQRENRRKNAVLSQEISENIDCKTKYLTQQSESEAEPAKKSKDSQPQLSNMTDEELFEFLRTVIEKERLYLNPLFERQVLIDRFGLSKESVGAAFSRGSHYGSLPAYINECRLFAGAAMLKNEPDKSIAEVATACGFTNVSVFTRNFKQRYAITPTEFREKK